MQNNPHKKVYSIFDNVVMKIKKFKLRTAAASQQSRHTLCVVLSGRSFEAVFCDMAAYYVP